MKLTNTTDWPDYMLRRMVSWCCRELGLPVRFVQSIRFRNKSCGYSGHCYHWKTGCRIVCSISRANYDEASLVNLTAHELRHALAELHNERTRGRGRRIASSEKVTCHDASEVEAAFTANRDTLLSEWNKTTANRQAKPKPTKQEQRAEKAQAKLTEWQRKAKLATTKIKKYRKQVRYYEKALSVAATKSK